MAKKVYIAARYGRRPDMAVIADTLKSKGFEVTSRWVYGNEEGLTREQVAIMDYEDVLAADVCLSFTETRGSYNVAGARHTEFGIAYQAEKQCDIIGDLEIVFHHLPTVKVYKDVSDWVAANG